MLFSIHPMDGSLLVWHVDWLDEYQPGMFRQAQVQPQLSHGVEDPASAVMPLQGCQIAH